VLVLLQLDEQFLSAPEEQIALVLPNERLVGELELVDSSLLEFDKVELQTVICLPYASFEVESSEGYGFMVFVIHVNRTYLIIKYK